MLLLPLCFILLLHLLFAQSSPYKVTSNFANSSHIILNLQYTGTSTYYVKPTSTIFPKLTLTAICHSYSDLTLQITDSSNTRLRIPSSPPFPQDPYVKSTFPLNLSLFTITVRQNPFEIKITRSPNNETIFDTTNTNLIFSKYYIEISTKVATQYAWGFGERFSDRFRLQTGKYTVFGRDRPSTIDTQSGHQTYGSFPIYLIRDSKSNNSGYHLNYFRNANAMDIIISNVSDTYMFTYKTIGGMIDFRFFLQNNPTAVLEKFHSYLGGSHIPPFWAMGFHQSRWGYVNVSMLEDVLKKYKENDIPLDALWSDIDYMNKCEDFTIDEASFPLDRMAAIIKQINYIPIVDAGIHVNQNGLAYIEGKKRDVFIKDAVGEEFHGLVWPGAVTFVDFLHPNATEYWHSMLEVLYSKLKFSGIWLDMNEMSNFCNGPCNFPKHAGFDYSNDLPYHIGVDQEPLQMQTISLNCTRHGGILQADVHIYTGLLQTAATYSFLKKKNMRPFILSRSTAPGSGTYGFHWTGDNAASFDFLRNSIHENFMFQIWGIQMVGADICGFVQNTTYELCARWHQLGAFYPFSRNHNAFMTISQEPYAFGEYFLEEARASIKLRYSLLKFYYRIFITQRGRGAVFKPLFFSFPNDLITITDNEVSETQFMIGEQLMFAPVVTFNSTERSVYFPDNFYNYFTGQFIESSSNLTITNYIQDPIPVFLRQSYGVFVQNTRNITRTTQLGYFFQFTAGLVLTSSDDEKSDYQAKGSILSISDYADESKIARCISEGCLYNTVWKLQEYRNGSQVLVVESTYVGATGLNELIAVININLYKRDGSRMYSLEDRLYITKTEKQTIVLRMAGEEKKQTLNLKEE